MYLFLKESCVTERERERERGVGERKKERKKEEEKDVKTHLPISLVLSIFAI